MRNTRIRTAIAAAISFAAFAAPVVYADPFGPIHVAANRHQYVGKGCPVDILYTASINFNMPHPKGFVFNYWWERSDGAKSAHHVIRPGPNERSLVVREHWHLGSRGQTVDAAETFHVASGNDHVSTASPTVHVECR